jgi:UDP-N-acetylmuramate dehydrogenase
LSPSDPFYPLLTKLRRIPRITVERNVPLARLTRFGIGGPVSVLVETRDADAFMTTRYALEHEGAPWLMLGDGTNVIAADKGYPGVLLRYLASRITRSKTSLLVDAGAPLQDLVDSSIRNSLAGLHTMTGIPGSVGGAIYGNAGAYGRSIDQSLERVRVFDGDEVCFLDNSGCQFSYRESVFKVKKAWTILSASFRLVLGDSAAMALEAEKIRAIRDKKYPSSMRCAGSIFKNCLFDKLPAGAASQVPPELVREGKVPAAWFLEQVGSKGYRIGDILVADYHANLIYNGGAGQASDLLRVIFELKRRVFERFGFELEEEVQYIGFDGRPA